MTLADLKRDQHDSDAYQDWRMDHPTEGTDANDPERDDDGQPGAGTAKEEDAGR